MGFAGGPRHREVGGPRTRYRAEADRPSSRGGGHLDLARGKPVQAASEVVIRDGEIKYINNASGRYEPKGPAARQAAEATFGRAGFDVEGKYIEMIFDPQRGWIPVDGQ